MKPLRKILTDPAMWSLVLMNLIFIKYFIDHPGSFNTYIWIYWLQSVLIGIFNFFNLLTLKNMEPGSFTMNGKPMSNHAGKGCISVFFLFHFEGFHVGYAVFIAVIFHKTGSFDANLFKYAFFALLVNQLIWFIQQKMKYSQHSPNVGSVFFLPYLRIVPMHLCILVPAFLHTSSMMLFLILKTLMDVVMHLITTRWYWSDRRPVIGDIASTDLI